MDIREFIGQYKYKNELHAHTYPASKCAEMSARDTVRVYAESGVDSLVITNHINLAMDSAERYLADYYEARDEGEKLGVNVILGVEIVFVGTRNDYLVYGVSEDEIGEMITYVQKDLESFYKRFKNDKNVILQAHPFRDKMTLAPLDLIDGIESYNLHPGHNGRIGIAARYATQNGLLVSCGSDYHHPDQHALALVRSKEPLRDSYDVANLIKSRDYIFDIGGNVVFPYADK